MLEPRQSSPVLILIDHSSQPRKYLLEWHDKWRCFMFPVTVARKFDDEEWGLHSTETDADAALRGAAEATKCCLRKNGLRRLVRSVSVTAVSHSQGHLTGYQIDVFHYRLSGNTDLLRLGQWLTLEDVVNENLGPISEVARTTAKRLLELQLDVTTPEQEDALWEAVHPIA